MTQFPYPVPTVGALILNPREEVLLIKTHKWKNRWGIPGGKIHEGEKMEEGLKREILEETGLKIREIQFALVQEAVNSPEFYRPAHFILINYFAFSAETRVTLNNEAEAYRWVKAEEALSMDLNTYTKVLIEAYLKWKKE